jgi:hypothetical protein
MKFADASTLGWFVAGLVAFVGVGCAPAGDQTVDSLPWSNASVPRSVQDVVSPADAERATNVASESDAAELEFRDRIVQTHIDDLRRISAEPRIVQAVRKANDMGWQTQEQIEQQDVRWRQTKGVDDPLIQVYLNNPCADLLRQAQQNNPSYVELFLMDNKGCIVAESDKTSDFWQGDEAKWTECYNGGEGRVYVGDVEYDQSTRLYVIQISLPIYDERNTIGAMTVSVSSRKRD